VTSLVRLGRPSNAQLDALIARKAGLAVSYDFVGSTLHPDQWPGRTQYTKSRDLGSGVEAFEAGVGGLRSWACHGGIDAEIYPADAPIEEGTTLLVILAVGPMRIIVPDRIVAVIDEPDRFGFAYGTLPGHQEVGEESYLVERHGDGRVTATIAVDARAATKAARAIAPVVTVFQRAALKRYLAALAAAAGSS